MNYTLQELLEIPRLRDLLDSLDEIHSMPSAIVDVEGNVLIATAWQDLCTKFHRTNPETEKMCLESDNHISSRLEEQLQNIVYRCPMGLVDSATPIIIEGKHYGNVFTGQLFTEAPDEARFVEQARQYGFDETEYLAAILKVPVFSEEQLKKNLAFISKLTQMLAEQGLTNKRTLESAELLKKSVERHRTILQTTMDGVWTVDLQGRFVEVNDSYSKMSGYSTQELLALNISCLDISEQPEDSISRIEQIKSHGTALFEARHRRKDGSLFDVEVSAQYFDSDGGQIVAFIRDISERKQAELELKHSSDLLRYIIHHDQSALAVHDREMRYVYVSQRYLDDYKVRDKDIIGKHHYDVFPDLPQKWRDVHKRALEGILSSSEEDSYEREDGTIEWTRWECRPWYESDGTVGGIIVYSEVITGRKRIEDEIRLEQTLNNAIIEGIPGTFYIFDETGRFVRWNAYERDEIIGKSDEECSNVFAIETIHPDDRAFVLPKISNIFVNGAVETAECRALLRGGPEFRWFLLSGRRMIINGHPLLIGIGTDITDRKMIEDALKRSEANLSATLNATADGILAVAADGKIQFYNNRFTEMWNIPEEILDTKDDNALLGHVLTQLLEPELFLKEVERLYNLPENSCDTVEFKDGRIFERFSFPQRQADMQKLGRVWSFRDVTEQKQTSEAILNSNKLLQTIINNAPVRIFWKSKDLRYLGANNLFANDAGLTSATELIDRDDYQLAWKEQANLYREDDWKVIESGIPKLFYDEPQTTPTGNTIWLSTSKVPLRNEAGNIIGVLGIYDDITVRKEAEIHNTRLLLRQRAILDNLPMMAWLKDTESRLEMINEPYAKACGRTIKECIGKNDFDLFPEEMARGFIADDREVCSSGQKKQTEESISTPDGIKWHQTYKTPLFDETGTVVGTTGIAQDITEKKNMMHQLTAAKEKAETATKAKSSFLAAMSHEIRTPMNGVIGMAQLLEMGELSAEQRKYVNALKASGISMLSLINDILDLSKIEAGKFTIEEVEFNLKNCVNDAVLMQKHVILEKGLSLGVNISESIPEILIGDPLRIKQMLLNVLSNAVKFTAEGNIGVSIQTVEQHGTAILIEIAVHDSGVGISSNALGRIFQPFVQEDDSTTRRFGGTGLGLAITHSLAELMGGSIVVDSMPGVGSCFRITLPFTAVEINVPSETLVSAATVHWDGPGLRVLYAEDNEVNTIFGVSLLNKLGHDVVVVGNGRDALAALQEGRFDIVLMDIQMPVMNGEEALLEIRKKELITGIHQPVIAVTAYALRGEKSKFMADGFDGYVSKPLLIDELIKEIRRVLGDDDVVQESSTGVTS